MPCEDMILKKKTKRVEANIYHTANEHRTKVHAQRKFAQGSPSLNPHKDRDRNREKCLNDRSPCTPSEIAVETIAEECPKTEDFLTFLCFRGTNLLPEHLESFNNAYVCHNSSIEPTQSTKCGQNSLGKTDKNGEELVKKKESPPQASIAPLKQNLSKKNIHSNQTKFQVSRIHSNFRRRTAASHISTRLSALKPITYSRKGAKAGDCFKSKPQKANQLPDRVATRSQQRYRADANSKQVSGNHDRAKSTKLKSRTEGNSSSTVIKQTSQEKVTSSLRPVSRLRRSMHETKNAVQTNKLTRRTDVSKSTKSPSKSPIGIPRKQQSLPNKSSTSSSVKKTAASPLKSNENRKLTKNSKEMIKLKRRVSTEHQSPRKMTREASKRLSLDITNSALSNVKSVRRSEIPKLAGNTRPTRRTKEAAALYLTIIGQEEGMISSEEETASASNSEETLMNKSKVSKPSSKTQSAKAGNTNSGVKTRRERSSSSGSPEAKRRAILREAAKRFIATRSHSSDIDSSSSSEEDENPAEKVRTRSASLKENQIKLRSCKILRKHSPDPVELSEMRRTRRGSFKAQVKGLENSEEKLLKKRPTRKSDIAQNKTVSKEECSVKKSSENQELSSPKRAGKCQNASANLETLIDAPVFYPTEKEFNDPMEYLEKIRTSSEQFGICRIVPPPSFKPECEMSDAMRFTAYNQYVHRMFRRKGANSRQLDAIHRHLKSLSIDYQQAPCIGGIEVDISGLYQAVETLGGPKKVMEKNLWSRVADMLKIPRAAQDRLSKLDGIYCKYILPYATLSEDERRKLFQKIDSDRRTDGEIECVAKGVTIALSTFYRIARNTLSVWFPATCSSATDTSGPVPEEVESLYWKLTSDRSSHLCVHSGSIDSGQAGYGFLCNKTARHPWNLKVLTNNNASILRSLGPAVGVTVPTLHVGMLFSACCWYRDPHGLPWIEYLHTGADKIWYGVPSIQESVLREAMMKTVPDLIQNNKSVWLSSDTVMIPPSVLTKEGVKLSRTVQKAGQYMVVWPKAFTSSLCTGYSVSESVYFAPPDWLPIGDSCFRDSRASCEPTVFSLQHLLWSIAHDNRSSAPVLKSVLPLLQRSVEEELQYRESLRNLGVRQWEKAAPVVNQIEGKKKRRTSIATSNDAEVDCDICRMSLFFSRAQYQLHSDSPSTWCLMHAVQKVKEKPRQIQHFSILYSFTEEELRTCIQQLQDNIRNKSQRRVTGHSRSVTN